MKRVDLKVGFACNNHCSFCVQGDKRSRFKPRKCEEIKKILIDEFALGARSVVFTGGEPTVHPDLLESVAYAKDLGYQEIQIQSNGRTFSDEAYLSKLIAAGVTEFSPSIHGFYKETHDSLVHAEGAWDQVVRGLILLKKYNQRIIINSVVTEQNYREIPLLATLLLKIGVTQFQFAFIHILGTAEKNKTTVVPKKSRVMPYIWKALDLAQKSGVPAFTEAIPYCLMQGYEHALSENIMPETSVVDAEYRTDNYAEYRWTEGKVKHEKCRNCIRNGQCEGPWKEYPELYGWDEFSPILAE